MCVEYISLAIESRKGELGVISEQINSLDIFDENVESEVCFTFIVLLCILWELQNISYASISYVYT